MKLEEGTKEALRQFARNARWGTCGACPHDANGRQLPELCSETNRSDHHLKFKDLAEKVEREIGMTTCTSCNGLIQRHFAHCNRCGAKN